MCVHGKVFMEEVGRLRMRRRRIPPRTVRWKRARSVLRLMGLSLLSVFHCKGEENVFLDNLLREIRGQ
jgi:hypothetical protein